MNRSALAIQMLTILYGRQSLVSREELSQLLETNLRNIVELKKELEVAGYHIESVRGKYGGYRLREEGIFPAQALDTKEKSAINEALTYLQAHKDFIYYTHFRSAMDKVKATLKQRASSSETIYMSETRAGINALEDTMLQAITRAKEERREVVLHYHSTRAQEFEKRTIHPYEIIANSDGFYVLAMDYSQGKVRSFKFFKIISLRMKDVSITSKTFVRDVNFSVSEHTGTHALMKEMCEVELRIQGLQARLTNEQDIENTLEKRYYEGELYIRFMMEGPQRVRRFILSMGSACTVVAPRALQQEIMKEYQDSLAKYAK